MRNKFIAFLLVVAAVIIPACRMLTGESQELPPYDPANHKQLTFSPVELPAAQKGIPYDVQLEIGNVETFAGHYEITEGQLPPGLTLERVKRENTVKITGVPLEEGLYPFVLFVQCAGTNDPGQEGKMKYAIEVKSEP
ncbi:MAG: hypothetical protein AB9891_03530 [Anaerolineaceae bacterium]